MKVLRVNFQEFRAQSMKCGFRSVCGRMLADEVSSNSSEVNSGQGKCSKPNAQVVAGRVAVA